MQNNPKDTLHSLTEQEGEQPHGSPQNEAIVPPKTRPPSNGHKKYSLGYGKNDSINLILAKTKAIQARQERQRYNNNLPNEPYEINHLSGRQSVQAKPYNYLYTSYPPNLQPYYYRNQSRGYYNEQFSNWDYPTANNHILMQQNYHWVTNSTIQSLYPYSRYGSSRRFVQEEFPFHVTDQTQYEKYANASAQENYSVYENLGWKNNNYLFKNLQIPTLKHVLNSNHFTDVALIFNAFNGFGKNDKDHILRSDSKTVMNILTHRSYAHLQKVKKEYQKIYHTSLIDRTKSEFLDPLKHIAVALEHGRADMDAYFLRMSNECLGSDDSALIYIFCTRTSRQIAEICKSYLRMFHTTFLSDIKCETNGYFLQLLSFLINEPRDESDVINPALADWHVRQLFIESTFQTETPECLIHILGSYNYMQIRHTLHHYEMTNGKKLINWISEFSDGNYERLLISICNFAENPIRFFSTYLQNAIISLNFNTVIRIICTRYEIDLGNILQDYRILNNSEANDSIQRAFGDKHPESVDALLMMMGVN